MVEVWDERESNTNTFMIVQTTVWGKEQGVSNVEDGSIEL